jgi:hypothetical protein
LNEHWKEVRQENHHRLSRDGRIQRDDQMGGCDLSKGSVIDVSGDDESEEIEETEDFTEENI